jgi:hypothetical protein
MHAFINSPAFAKLIALQIADEQIVQQRERAPRERRLQATRAERRARRATRRTEAVPETGPRTWRPAESAEL